jgi:hypothetical protein
MSFFGSGLLQATVFRHFLGFLGLHGTSRRFIHANCKLAVVKAIGAFPLVKRGFQKVWGLSPPLSARFLYPPHLHKDPSCQKCGLMSGLIISLGCVRSPIQ